MLFFLNPTSWRHALQVGVKFPSLADPSAVLSALTAQFEPVPQVEPKIIKDAVTVLNVYGLEEVGTHRATPPVDFTRLLIFGRSQ